MTICSGIAAYQKERVSLVRLIEHNMNIAPRQTVGFVNRCAIRLSRDSFDEWGAMLCFQEEDIRTAAGRRRGAGLAAPLTLGAYAPLRYVIAHKQAVYDQKYSTVIRGGQSFFRQVDREESLIHLLRVNILKRMESSVASFDLTIQRQR